MPGGSKRTKTCNGKYWDRGWRDAVRSMLSTFKLEAGCADCGYNLNPVALQFDHVRGEKEFALWEGYRYTLDVILDEMDKCEVVCANCHSVRTHLRAVG